MRYRFIAFHWYDSANNYVYFQQHVEDVIALANQRNIGRVWLTEFGVSGSDDEVASFLRQVITLTGIPWSSAMRTSCVVMVFWLMATRFRSPLGRNMPDNQPWLHPELYYLLASSSFTTANLLSRQLLGFPFHFGESAILASVYIATAKSR